MFHLTHRYLAGREMQGYEVSQFAASVEHHSKHNLKYWDHTPYLGLGPSAHSFDGDRRWWNIRRTDPYQESVAAGRRPVEDQETLDARALVLESLMTGLRTYVGVDLGAVGERRGIDLIGLNAELIERLSTTGLASFDGSRVVPTLDGLAVADAVVRQFDVG
jgi:oxygen-independent coproporphyrinogen-3 oxidase